MNRRALVAGNWKMNGSRDSNANLIHDIVLEVRKYPGIDVLVCPPAVYVESVGRQLEGSAVQLGGRWEKTDSGQRYADGKWVVVDYGRPLLRGRTNIFGAGAEYGKVVSDGSPVWRMGANDSAFAARWSCCRSASRWCWWSAPCCSREACAI